MNMIPKSALDADGMVRRFYVASVGDDLEYVLTDSSVDRQGDVVDPKGWNLRNFERHPIALFNHDRNAPIGLWKNVKKVGDKLIAKLEIAEAGTSARIDEMRSLARQGILRAVSVGFRPTKAEPLDGRDWSNGIKYLEQELLEVSLVTVPANQNALQVARGLGVSDDTMSFAFGEYAKKGETEGRGTIGEQAAIPPMKAKRMTISERIELAQRELNVKKDALTELLKDENYDIEVEKEIGDAIEQIEERIVSLKRSEKALASASQPVAHVAPTEARRPFAVAAKTVAPKDYVYRAMAVAVKSHVDKTPRLETLKAMYGEDEATKAVFEVVTKAAAAPAMTTTTGWAAELVQTAVADFIESLPANSVYPRLSAIGGRFSFGQNGIISLPSRTTSTSLAGSFVGQGAAIPVRQGLFTATTLTPKKLAVITTFTSEMAQYSTPQIESVLRSAIQEDTAVAIDTVLLDNVAASAIRPAGLRNGVTVTTATSGGGFAALVGDLKALTGALVTSSNGNLRNPVFIMNPVNALSIGLIQNAGGEFAFRSQIENGTLLGYPVILSTTVTAGVVIMLDAADFFSATGDDPRFDVSDQATLHMEDTSPLPIATGAQGSGVLATPTRSLFQTDSIGLRMILPMNWALRRAGTLAHTASVTW